MPSLPPEELLIAARKLDPNYHADITLPWSDPAEDELSLGPRPAWRMHVPPIIRRLWGRLDYETRVAVFVVAASEPGVDWEP